MPNGTLQNESIAWDTTLNQWVPAGFVFSNEQTVAIDSVSDALKSELLANEDTTDFRAYSDSKYLSINTILVDTTIINDLVEAGIQPVINDIDGLNDDITRIDSIFNTKVDKDSVQSWEETEILIEQIVNNNSLSKINNDTSSTHLELQNVRFGGTTEITPQENSQGWRRPVISFVFDHADTNVYRLFDTLFTNRGVNFSLSIYAAPQPTRSSYYMSLSEALELQNNGHEIESHVSGSDAWSAPNTEAGANNYIDSLKSYHQSLGFDVKNANYGGGSATDLIKKVIKKYYRSGRTAAGSNNINTPPIDQYYLSAFSMDGGNYNTWATYVDSAINNKAWMIFYGHAYTTGWYDVKKNDDGVNDAGGDYIWQKIGRLIDYIKAQPTYDDSSGVTILVKDKALDEFYNVVDIGVMTTQAENSINEYSQYYYNREYFRVSSLGQIGFYGYKNIPIPLPFNSVYSETAVIGDFPNNRVSYLPSETGGHLLVTDRVGNERHIINQFQFKHEYNTNKLFYRQAASSSSWQSWRQLTNEFTDTYQSAATNATLVTGFVEDNLNLGFATTGVGYPAAGILFTDRRLMDYDARTQYQMLMGTISTNDMYIRAWNTSTGDWRSWRKINPVSSKGTFSVNFDNIVAGTVASKNIDISTTSDFGTISVDEMIIVTPPSTIEAGLIWSAFISAANIVTIRIFNGSGADVNPAAANWKVRVLK